MTGFRLYQSLTETGRQLGLCWARPQRRPQARSERQPAARHRGLRRGLGGKAPGLQVEHPWTLPRQAGSSRAKQGPGDEGVKHSPDAARGQRSADERLCPTRSASLSKSFLASHP